MAYAFGRFYNMSNFNKDKDSPLKYVTIKSTNKSHITIKNRDKCLQECANKPCTYLCPSRVFSWAEKEIKIAYSNCIECLACPWTCPYNNIAWSLPAGGFGIKYSL